MVLNSCVLDSGNFEFFSKNQNISDCQDNVLLFCFAIETPILDGIGIAPTANP